MTELDTILERYINVAGGVGGGLLGAAFVVKDKHGRLNSSHSDPKESFQTHYHRRCHSVLEHSW
jgi:hypothetical protein